MHAAARVTGVSSVCTQPASCTPVPLPLFSHRPCPVMPVAVRPTSARYLYRRSLRMLSTPLTCQDGSQGVKVQKEGGCLRAAAGRQAGERTSATRGDEITSGQGQGMPAAQAAAGGENDALLGEHCLMMAHATQELTTRRSRPPLPRSQKRLKWRPSVSRPLSSLHRQGRAVQRQARWGTGSCRRTQSLNLSHPTGLSTRATKPACIACAGRAAALDSPHCGPGAGVKAGGACPHRVLRIEQLLLLFRRQLRQPGWAGRGGRAGRFYALGAGKRCASSAHSPSSTNRGRHKPAPPSSAAQQQGGRAAHSLDQALRHSVGHAPPRQPGLHTSDSWRRVVSGAGCYFPVQQKLAPSLAASVKQAGSHCHIQKARQVKSRQAHPMPCSPAPPSGWCSLILAFISTCAGCGQCRSPAKHSHLPAPPSGWCSAARAPGAAP